ncbi:response regulator transcription factor [bacterium]|nr:response regulator transcription factor [bacterium]
MGTTSRRVLVVDDDEALRSLLTYKLEKHGFSVDTLEDGRQVVDHLRDVPTDVLLLDLMMPRVDGFQVLRLLREDSKARPKATIIVSARGREEDILHAFNFGVADYVTKPFSLNVLMARIDVALQSKAAPEIEAEAAPEADAETEAQRESEGEVAADE